MCYDAFKFFHSPNLKDLPAPDIARVNHLENKSCQLLKQCLSNSALLLVLGKQKEEVKYYGKVNNILNS
jgi:hypothetical protein